MTSGESCLFHNVSKKYINESVNVNTMAVAQLTRMVLPYMYQRKKGAIVYFSSTNSALPSPYNSLYAASNCYVEKLAESLTYEYSGKNLHFQCLNPFFYKFTCRGLRRSSSDGLQYSQYSIRTLGYANHAFGNWIVALQVVSVQSYF